jgi:hypothetical protein
LQLAGVHTPSSGGGGGGPGPDSLRSTHRYHYVLFQEDGEALASVLDLLDRGVVSLPGAVREYSLEELPEAFASESGGKAVVIM